MGVRRAFLALLPALVVLSVSGADNKLCLNVYDVSNRTIIKSTESIANGAKYLGSIEKAGNKQECEYECCRIPGCNIAVYHDTADRDCYFFDCGKIQDFKCIFAVHDNYLAMGMMVDRSDLEKTKIHEQAKHELDLSLLKTNTPSSSPKSIVNDVQQQQPYDSQQRGYPEPAAAPARPYRPEPRPEDQQPYNPDYYQPAPEPEPTPQRLSQPQLSSEDRASIRERQRSPAPPPRKPQAIMDKSVAKPKSPFNGQPSGSAADMSCNRWQWLCHTGDACIANYDLCDGIPQCADKSDEDVEMCRELRRRRPDQTNDRIPNDKYRHDPWDAPGVRPPQPPQTGDQQARPADSNKARAPSAAPVQEHGLGRAGNGQFDSASKQVVVANQKNPSPVVTNTNTQIIALREKSQVTVERIDSGSTSLAALILGLGMCLLAVFLVYISCRLKTARRRIKRQGKAMDSAEGDMLINGMYL